MNPDNPQNRFRSLQSHPQPPSQPHPSYSNPLYTHFRTWSQPQPQPIHIIQTQQPQYYIPPAVPAYYPLPVSPPHSPPPPQAFLKNMGSYHHETHLNEYNQPTINPLRILEQAIIDNNPGFVGFLNRRDITLPNEEKNGDIQTPNKAVIQKVDSCNNSNSSKLSMPELLKKIQQQCQHPNENHSDHQNQQNSQHQHQQIVSQSMQEARNIHGNPIYTKINKYAQKLRKSTDPSQKPKEMSQIGSSGHPSIIVLDTRGRKISHSSKKVNHEDSHDSNANNNNGSNSNNNSDGNNQAYLMSKTSSKMLSVEASSPGIRKIHTDQSQLSQQNSQQPPLAPEVTKHQHQLHHLHQHQHRHPMLATQGTPSPLHAANINISTISNIHKNIRKKIIKSSIHQSLKADFGVQVCMEGHASAFSRNQTGQASQSRESDAEHFNEDGTPMLSDFRASEYVNIKFEQSIYQSYTSPNKKLTLKSIARNPNIDTAQNKKNRQKLSMLQSIESLHALQDSSETDRIGGKNQVKENIEVDDQIEESYEESDVMKDQEEINYKNNVINANKQQEKEKEKQQVFEERTNTQMVIPSLPRESLASNANLPQQNSSLKFMFTQSKQQSLNFSKQIPKTKLFHSPQIQLQSQSKPKNPENNNDNTNNNHDLSSPLTASKITNIISSFSELKQIIDFQFGQFRQYMGQWVQQLREGYERVLMEKEETIFVLQIEKISLQDQLRDLKQKFAIPSHIHTNPPQQPPQNNKPLIKPHYFSNKLATTPTRKSKRQAKFKQKAIWRELNDVQETLTAQIYKIQAERDREFQGLRGLGKQGDGQEEGNDGGL